MSQTMHVSLESLVMPRYVAVEWGAGAVGVSVMDGMTSVRLALSPEQSRETARMLMVAADSAEQELRGK